jgi:large subunit ribosomal protein L24
MANLRVKKGDKIIVLTGKDKGKTGIVEKISHKTRNLLVNGLNVVKKHAKPTKQNPAGGVIEISRPMPIAKVQVICPSCSKPTRIGYSKEGKSKERVCKKCGKAIHIQKESSDEKK